MAAILDCMMLTSAFNFVTRQDSSLVLSYIHAIRASYLVIRDIARGPVRLYCQEPETGIERQVCISERNDSVREVQGRVGQSKVVGAYQGVGGNSIG